MLTYLADHLPPDNDRIRLMIVISKASTPCFKEIVRWEWPMIEKALDYLRFIGQEALPKN